MRLADFILSDMESILVEWEAFAATRTPAATEMTPLALRDHAEQILQAIAHDIARPQTASAQSEKSMGRAPIDIDAPETAAQTHATLRARSGFDINQLTSEYRALRATVLRLWAAASGSTVLHLDDVIRFNEAIDQALAESVSFFSAQVTQSRNLLLGMLGHDMRSPLQTIQMTATYLGALNAGGEITAAAGRLIRSGARMKALLDDLVDFNRTKLGLGINIASSSINLESLFGDEVDQLRAAHPGRQLVLRLSGDATGFWDGQRLQQLLGNLVQNAIKYGSTDSPIEVVVTGTEGEVLFEVRNAGPTVDSATMTRMFHPLQRGEHDDDVPVHGSLGLGLYIAREIARAHGGDVQATSGNSETVFSVRLPRLNNVTSAQVTR